MKRLTIIFLCLTYFLTNTIVYASGISTAYTAEQKIEKLKEYNIMCGYEDGNFYPQNNITRAEFCKIVSVISGLQTDKPVNNCDFFADVPQDHWANKYIISCCNNGLVNGVFREEELYFVDLDENGNEIDRSKLFYKDNISDLYGTDVKLPENIFAPDDYIIYQDALKILVCVLGYEDLAKQRGDYPYGYVSTAKEIGIIGNDFSSEDFISREITAEVVYNSLFVPLMLKKSISDENGDRTEFVIMDGSNGTELQTLYSKNFEKLK